MRYTLAKYALYAAGYAASMFLFFLAYSVMFGNPFDSQSCSNSWHPASKCVPTPDGWRTGNDLYRP